MCAQHWCTLVQGIGSFTGGGSLPYKWFWPQVTETIWSRCQNLIRKPGQKQRQSRERERRYLSGRMKCWERRQRSAVEANKKKTAVKKRSVKCDTPLTQLLWDGAVWQISNMLMRKRPTSPYLLNLLPKHWTHPVILSASPCLSPLPPALQYKKDFVPSASYRTFHSVDQHNLLTLPLWSQTTTNK